MTPLQIFIGYDEREPMAYHVLAHSIMTRASRPVSITPLIQNQLRRQGIYTRPMNEPASTAFTFTRFLVPALCGYKGVALFLDCDMLCRCDVYDMLLYPLSDPGREVYVCWHDYIPKNATKFLGERQTAYPRKNWSSAMLFDTEKCEDLTVDAVNALSGADLHRFAWTRKTPGALPIDFNWLVGEYQANPRARILHYTLGGPWFTEFEGCDQADDWFAERNAMHGSMADVRV